MPEASYRREYTLCVGILNMNNERFSATNVQTEEYVTVSELRKRGWTDALISRFLGEPDDRRQNPHYRSGPPMKLYNTHRVVQAEATAEYRAAQDARKGRREAAQKALATKKRRIAENVASVKIEVPQIAKDELIRSACQSYNSGGRGDSWARESSDPKFLERICVNYLRHRLTKYETHLQEIAGKVGVRDAYLEVKGKVLAAIAEQYDWLGDECLLQEQRMFEKESLRR
jgi:nucleosome binding factor SPN SPT16 subunit